MGSRKNRSGGSGAGKRIFSTFDVAELLEVDPGSVANWIDGGLLKAHRTPGGHRRAALEDLLDFLKSRNMPIPAALKTRVVRVVVVDDEPAMTQMISKAIRMEHPEYEVIEAHDGFRAGVIVATSRPDVVILDLRMPGMDGFEVCRMIKSGENTRHTHVIAVMPHLSDEAQQRVRACGAEMCLGKPLDLNELVARIDRVLGG